MFISGFILLRYTQSYFDPRVPKLSQTANENLQKIFDLVIERFILEWFTKLTDDEKFTADIRAQIQHINASNLIEQKLLPCIVHHVEHLLALTNAVFEPDDEGEVKKALLADDVVLQRLFSADHLHPALQSRHAESLYLQEIVRRLLPYLLIPPCLKRSSKATSKPPLPENGAMQATNIIDEAFSSSQFHHQLPESVAPSVGSIPTNQLSPNQTQAAQCARSFLTEIIANHVLLPALDSIANPDSLNTVFLFLLDPVIDNTDYPTNAPMVPLLNSYIDDWFKNAKELPPNMHMEALLHQPKQLGNFVQFMKSISCTSTMTVLLLMFEVINNIETESVSPTLCKRLKVPLNQLLYLLHTGRVMGSEDLDHHRPFSDGSTLCTDCGRTIPAPGSSQLLELLNLPPRLTKVIAEAVDDEADPLCVARLIHSSEWTSAFRTMCATMETLYLPAYMESPEYLGRLGASSPNPSPKHQFVLPDDVITNFGAESTPKLSHRTPSNSRRFVNSRKHSSSFSELGELKRPRGNRSQKSKDDMSANSTTTSRSSGRLRFRRRRSATPAASTTNLPPSGEQFSTDVDPAELQELDFSKWRVSIPFYTTSSGRRTSILLGSLGDSNVATSIEASMLLLTSLEQPDASLLSTSNLGYYTVIAEREVNGRMAYNTVNRKYAEFYVLEQRLVEFHGAQISRRLPSRRFGAQSRQFLENMKSDFEEYLKYLLSQPFLRTSELMYTFLTASGVEFTSNNLSDIRLGKFVKSVPILLAKEKGQFIDDFLTAFRSSCFIPRQNTGNQKGSDIEINQNSDSSISMHDHRLHSQLYWNNAGIPTLQKRVPSSEFCALEGSYVTSLYDLFGYLADNFRKPDPRDKVIFAPPPIRRQHVDSIIGKYSLIEDFISWIRRVGLSCWSTLKTFWYKIVYALEKRGWTFEGITLPPRDRLDSTPIVTPPTYLPSLLRRAVLNVGLVLRGTEVRDLVNLHLRSRVDQFLHLLVRNDVLASMLVLLRNSIFYPDPPRSANEKAERREEVFIGLRRIVKRCHLQWLSDEEALQRRLVRVFEIFQHGKWNKQLTYMLLDHILLEVFPDVFDPRFSSLVPAPR
ncbi:hypothetical protein Aperf_G00000113286 [Anoplocephala perfoliata]